MGIFIPLIPVFIILGYVFVLILIGERRSNKRRAALAAHGGKVFVREDGSYYTVPNPSQPPPGYAAGLAAAEKKLKEVRYA